MAISLQCTFAQYAKLERPLALLAPLADFLARLYIARIFLLSGWNKLADWETTLYLFTEEYHVPLVPGKVAAILGTGGELLFPLLLVLGVMTRLSAAGLFALNIVAVMSYWHVLKNLPVAMEDHLVWGVLLAILMTYQGRRWEIDRLWRKPAIGSSSPETVN
jgi:putative oxidoreductase